MLLRRSREPATWIGRMGESLSSSRRGAIWEEVRLRAVERRRLLLLMLLLLERVELAWVVDHLIHVGPWSADLEATRVMGLITARFTRLRERVGGNREESASTARTLVGALSALSCPVFSAQSAAGVPRSPPTRSVIGSTSASHSRPRAITCASGHLHCFSASRLEDQFPNRQMSGIVLLPADA